MVAGVEADGLVDDGVVGEAEDPLLRAPGARLHLEGRHGGEGRQVEHVAHLGGLLLPRPRTASPVYSCLELGGVIADVRPGNVATFALPALQSPAE